MNGSLTIFEISSLIVLIITALILTIAAYFSYESAKISKKSLQHKALLFLQKEYRTSEMLFALREIWDFYDFCLNKITSDTQRIEDEIKKEYQHIYQWEKNKIKNIPFVKALIKEKMKKESFDNQRRLVSHFYIHLYTLFKEEVLTDKQIRENFKGASSTIRKVCLPLEEQLVEIRLKGRPGMSDDIIEKEKKETTKNLINLADLIDDC